MNSNALHKQVLFWILTISPIFIGALLLTPIFLEYDFELSVNGIVTFASISKLQVSIMLLSIPVGALIARIHSTIQKEEDLELKNFEKTNIQDKAILEEVKECINFVKLELFPEGKLNNSNVNWIKAAKDIIRVVSYRDELSLKSNIKRCDELFERLNLYLYRKLQYKNGKLPVHFFCGSKTWENDYEEYLKTKTGNTITDTYLIRTYIQQSIGKTHVTFRSSVSDLAPDFDNLTISKLAINCIYDFINLFGEQFEDNNDSKNEFISNARKFSSLRGWPDWSNQRDSWIVHEMQISEGAAKFIYLQNLIE